MNHATLRDAMLRSWAVILVVGLPGCADLPTPAERVELAEEKISVLGLVEITLSGIGTAAMSASAEPVEASRGGPLASLAPVTEAGRGGIQMRSLSSGNFRIGTRGQPDGFLYIFVTFEVRNASSDGVAYATPRENLTFIAVSTPSTIPGTPVREILRFDGSRAATTDAERWTPTGAAYLTITQSIASLAPDVLQVFTEDEVAAITLPAGVSAFPYGFITRHRTATDTRTLAANPAADDYDGFVTFAFKVPLASSQAEDPFNVKLMVVAVDDSETRMTQSVEEQNAAGEAAFAAKVTDLSAKGVTLLLPGGSYGGSVSKRELCGVRSAGTVGSPISYVNGPC